MDDVRSKRIPAGLENPLGVGGEHLHEWIIATRTFRQTHGGQGGEEGNIDDAFDHLDGGLQGYECVEFVSSPAAAHVRLARTGG